MKRILKNILGVLPIIVIILLNSFNAKAQWTKCNGPYGGKVRFIEVYGDTLIITIDSKLYRSTDNGDSWQKVSSINDDVTLVKAHNAMIFVQTEEAQTKEPQLYRSIDFGASWIKLPRPLLLFKIESLCIRDSLLVAYSEWVSGTVVSLDSGKTWKLLGDFTSSKLNNIVSFGDIHFALSGTSLMVWRSKENKWVNKDVNRFSNIVGLEVIGDTLWACTLWSGTAEGVIISVDTGNTRRTVSGEGGAWFRIGKGMLLKGQFQTKISTDGGKSWKGIPLGSTNGVNNNKAIFLTDDFYGMMRSTDGGDTWFQIGAIPTYANSIFGFGRNIFFNLNSSSVFSIDGGDHWQPTDAHVVLQKDGVLFQSEFEFPFISRSVDTGKTWKMVTLNSGDKSERLYYYGFFTLKKDWFTYGLYNKIYKSTDSGKTWTMYTEFSKRFRGLVATENYFFGYKHDSASAAQYWPGLHRSSDKGLTWDKIAFTNDRIAKMVTIGNVLFAAVEKKGVFRSTDYGLHWDLIGFEDLTMTIFENFNDKLFVVRQTDGGCFMSTDLGDTWVNLGLEEVIVKNLLLCNDTLYAVTEKGLLKRGVEDVTSVESESSDNAKTDNFVYVDDINNIHMRLSQIITPKKYSIFNYMGQELLSGTIPETQTEYIVNGYKLPPGVYIVALSNGKITKACSIALK